MRRCYEKKTEKGVRDNFRRRLEIGNEVANRDVLMVVEESMPDAVVHGRLSYFDLNGFFNNNLDMPRGRRCVGWLQSPHRKVHTSLGFLMDWTHARRDKQPPWSFW
jgi:hypothetical protein